MKKTILLLFLCSLSLLILLACDKFDSYSGVGSKLFGDVNSKPSSDVSSAPSDDSDSKQSVNFDLSQYDSHGELSCGRIWVVKTISDWNTKPTKYFAYLDADGNVVYRWTPVGEVYSHGAYVDAMLPQDFVNDRAMIINKGFGTNATQLITLIDRDGNELYSSSWIFVEFYEKRNREREYHITDFDKEGYAYFVGRVCWDGNTEGNYGVYWLDDNGIHEFNAPLPKTETTLRSIKRINEYHFVSVGSYSILFDLQGDPVIDFNEAVGILPYHINIIDDKYIEASFTGKDGKNYVCVLDFNGIFIKSPVLKSEYVRDKDEWEKIDVNSILGTWIFEEAYRKDVLIITEKNVSWEISWANGQSESWVLYYNDSVFYDSYSELCYKHEKGKITLILDGGEIVFTRK